MNKILHHTHWHALPWHEAPDWAHWAAMDRRGGWFWYEEEPLDEDGYFTATAGRIAQFTHCPYPSHWRFSLQRRPDYVASVFFSAAELSHDRLPA